jgi:predicted site-specific integrase-resolvase
MLKFLTDGELETLVRDLVSNKKIIYHLDYRKRFLSCKEFEEYFNISKQTRINWAKSGLIKPFLDANGKPQYSIKEIKKLINMPKYIKITNHNVKDVIKNKIEEILLEFEETRLPTLKNKKELANYLGISEKTLYNYVSEGKIKPICIGGKNLFFNLDEILGN